VTPHQAERVHTGRSAHERWPGRWTRQDLGWLSRQGVRWEGRAGAGARSREAAARQDGGDLGRFNAAGFAGAGVDAAGDRGPPVFHLRAE